MTSPVPMERLDAVLLATDARAVLRGLGTLGAVELLPSSKGEQPAEDPSCAAVLAQVASLRRRLGTLAPTTVPERDLPAARAELERVGARIEAALAQRDEAIARAAQCKVLDESLAPFAGLPLPSDHATSLQFVRCEVGSVPEAGLAGLSSSLGTGALLVPLGARAGRSVVVVLATRSGASGMDQALTAAGFQRVVLPVRSGATLADLAREAGVERARAEAQVEELGRAIEALGREAAAPLAAAEHAALREQAFRDAEGGLLRTESAVVLSGYVPVPELPGVVAELASATSGRCAVETAPAVGEAPVLLRPPRAFAPFQVLVTTYGVPGYHELDPTVVTSLTFLLMFGMMFGDVGHGGVLAAVGLWLALRGRSRSMREAARVVTACGLSSMLFGALYGSCFGIEALKHHALWRDPLEGDPLTLLLVAAGTGVGVVSLGVVLAIANRLRAGDRWGAVLGRFGLAGLVFYWGALALVAGGADPRVGLPAVLFAVACWIAKEPVRVLVTGHREEGLGAVLAESLVGSFEGVLLYLSNTVSFVRLAAYAMSHAALLASAWALAEVADEAWGKGSALGLLAVVVGNVAALGLEGVVAAVQTLRLEYYEFFGKFFEGGGRPFRPFSLPAAGGAT